jgi:hypothetical protein
MSPGAWAAGAVRAGAQLLAPLLVLLASAAAAQAPQWSSDPAGDGLSIALVTIGPGELYWERFGHNAILVRDRERGTATLYNYGMFDFAQENFLPNFLRGLMRYSMLGRPADPDLAPYARAGRWIDVQELNFSPSQRAALRDFLAWNERPENSEYRYDYFEANCSTKVRDALDQALGGAIRRGLEGRSRGITYRMHALRLTAVQPWLNVGIHAGLGPSTDRPVSLWQEAFVPMELEHALREVRVTDDAGTSVPLVASERRIHEATVPDPSASPPRWLWRYAGAGLTIALALVLLVRAHRLRLAGAAALVLWLVSGLGGVALLLLWTATDHRAAWQNENLLLFDPLCLALLPAAVAWLRARAPGRVFRLIATTVAALALVALFAKTLPAFGQANLEWIGFWLPVHAALAWGLRRGGSSPAA